MNDTHYYIQDIDTGIYNREHFFINAKELLDKCDQKDKYCMIAIDIEYFKFFNEYYGMQAGDTVLRQFAQTLHVISRMRRGVAGYMFGDNFAMLIPYDPQCIINLYEKLLKIIKALDTFAGFFPMIGVYHLLPSESLPMETIYDKATFAQNAIHGNLVNRINYYSQDEHDAIKKEQEIIYGLQNALQEGKITYYLQPKCNIANGRIVGSEALVRWIDNDLSYAPSVFIPLLEKTGLISQVDIYIWRQVCKDLRAFIDQGHTPLPVSINLSRKDIYIIDVLKTLSQIVDEYDIPHELIEVEITESAYSEDFDRIKKILKDLRQAGFKTSMDDFGSGYSSLNMLKDVHVDLLKIDMLFLDFEEHTSTKGISIIETIINMAKVLEIPVIAEGVENEIQLESLKNIGCQYGQGYYFYKPMSVKDFYTLILDQNHIDRRGIHATSADYISMEELLNNQLLNSSLLDRMLGAFAYIKYDGSSVYRMKANEAYYQFIGLRHHDDVKKMREDNIKSIIHPDDWPNLLNGYQKAAQNPLVSQNVVYRGRYHKNQEKWVMGTIHYLTTQDDGDLFLLQIRDITEEIEREKDLEYSHSILQELIHISDSDTEFHNLPANQKREAFSLYSHMLSIGMLGAYCKEGYPLFFASQEIVTMLGYDSYQEFLTSIQDKAINAIYIEDRQRVIDEIGTDFYPNKEHTSTYRLVRKDGTVFWVLNRGRVIKSQTGKLIMISFNVDISSIMEKQFTLQDQVSSLSFQNQELRFLHNRIPSGYHRCDYTPNYDFLYISNSFLNILGYRREEIKELFDDKFINLVHPDDVQKIKEYDFEVNSSSQASALEYRVKTKNDGYHWVVDQSTLSQYNDKTYYQGAITDVNELVDIRYRMHLLRKASRDDIVLLECQNDDLVNVEILAAGNNHKQHFTDNLYASVIKKMFVEGKEGHGQFYRLYQLMLNTIHTKETLRQVFQSQLTGQLRWVAIHFEYIESRDGLDYFICILSDMTELQQLQNNALDTNAQLQTLLDLTKINYAQWNPSTKELTLHISNMNDKFLELLGLDNLGRHCVGNFPDSFLSQSWIKKEDAQEFIAFLNQALEDGHASVTEIHLQNNHEDIWIEVRCQLIRNAQNEKVLIGYYRDVTDYKNKNQDYLQTMVETDVLTGLYNRFGIRQNAKTIIDDPESQCAFIMIDMDNFKLANDIFGHLYGDSLLTRVATTLQSVFNDALVSRMGGDEFLIITKETNPIALTNRITRLIQELETKISIDNKDIIFTASIGYSLKPDDGQRFSVLYEKADIAMFAAKLAGKNQYRQYHSSMKKIRKDFLENKKNR